jgi:serine/threonine-protein kinase
LIGRPPFNGDTPVAIAYQHVNEKPIAPSAIDPSVAITLDTIALHSLAKSPGARYQTATEMRADVERAMAGMPINASLPIDIANAPTQAIPTTATVSAAPTQAIPVTKPATSPISTMSSPAPVKKRSTAGLIGGSLAVLAAVLVIIFGGSALLGNGGDSVTVPKLVGKTIDEATVALENVGLILGEQTPATSDTVPAGEIISQDPAAEEIIEKGQAINVVVSAGPELTTVPDLVNLTSSELASDSLKQAGLVLGKVTVEDSDKPEGTVISQTPLANDSIAVGTRVDIVVSSGKIAMPNVVGLTKTQAKNDLMNAGFQVDFITEETADAPDNTVIAQSPKEGELVLKGSTVTITIAKAPVVVPTPTPTATPSPSAT